MTPTPRVWLILLMLALLAGWIAHGTLAPTPLLASSSQNAAASAAAACEQAAAYLRHAVSLPAESAGQSLLSVAPAAATSAAVCEDPDSSAYMLRHGIDLPLGQRLRLINAERVQLLRDKVVAGNLLEGAANTLMVGIVNFGYLDLALTWICFAQMHNLNNFLLGAVDEASYQRLQELGTQALT